VLARDGVGGLRVEVLAKRCGVTKGSFYWHFKDRQALLEALLDHWKEGRIRDIEKPRRSHPGQGARTAALCD
jgi:AcrR family transcriptional regulator